MILAKGLTAGYVPMGATMLSEQIYAGIADGAAEGVPIGHGATYSAHPVAAAVALEVLRLYTEGGVLANAQRVAPLFGAGLDALRQHPLVGDARHGLLGALELVKDKAIGAASILRSDFLIASSRPPTETGSCSAALATASSVSPRH
jgi:adenosylmethionine-8-amino-7-oxononanoate aminotransferase